MSALILACIVVYVGVALSGSVPWNVGLMVQPGGVLARGALIPAQVARGEAWRLLSSMFLHSGFVHIGLNMLSLYFLGAFAESAFGRGRFFALYMLSGLAGGVAYLYFGGFHTPAVGASGAIFGLLGGILGYSVRQGTFSWRNPIIRQLLVLLAINLYIGFSIPNISITAHLGGLAGGFVFCWLMAPTLYARKTARALSPVIVVLGAEVILVAVWFLL